MSTNADFDNARDDLAFMRALVAEGGRLQASIGAAFFWAGVLYGLQCVGHWLEAVGLIDPPPSAMLALVTLPTVLFVGVLIWIAVKSRADRPRGVASRALSAVFQGAGYANLAMAAVFAYGAYKAQSISIWFYHPIVVCMFQGVAWYVAAVIQRKAWLGWVAAGWFATTLAAGLLVGSPAFILAIAAALFILMAAPGYVLMRAARPA